MTESIPDVVDAKLGKLDAVEGQHLDTLRVEPSALVFELSVGMLRIENDGDELMFQSE